MLERKSQLWAFSAAVMVMAAALWTAHPVQAATYNGTVGQPITIDARMVPFIKMVETAGYYWDWFGDGRPEFFTTNPQAQHTWHSAFSGSVRVGVLDTDHQLDWGLISVEVTGPRNVITVTSKSSGDLHIDGPQARHLGPDAQGGQLERQIPDSSFVVLAADGSEVPFDVRALAEGGSQVAAFPLYMPGAYRVRIVGTNDGPFSLTMCGTQNDNVVVEKTFTGDIRRGETLVLDMAASCPDGALETTCGKTAYCPGLGVEPSQITLMVTADATYTVPITIRETFDREPLKAVHLSCSDIVHSVNVIPGSDVSFSPNDFDMEDGEQTVIVSIRVPQAFSGKAVGTINIECADGGSRTVDIVVRTEGACPPHCLSIGPVTGIVGEPVTFDASSSYDRDGYIQAYLWDWGDGTADFSSGPVITHTWAAPFAGQARLVIFDDSDQCADTLVDVTITNP